MTAGARLGRAVPYTALAALCCIGCMGPGWTDEGSDVVSQLGIEIPESATDIVGNTDSGVKFFMPNDQWRGYVSGYYPPESLTQTAADSEFDGSVPAECVPAFRAGTPLVQWTTGAPIQVGDSGEQADRGVLVIPDCRPGSALVQWILVRNP